MTAAQALRPVRLATVNAIGFSGTTIMPLWLGRISDQFEAPPWFAGLSVLTLVGGAALLNLATPLLFRAAQPLLLARAALIGAAAGQLLCTADTPLSFIAGSLVAGGSFGVLLNVTNRLMGSVDHVQRGYSIFVLIEVCFATLLFLGCSELMARSGPLSVFWVMSAIAMVGIPIIGRLPSGLQPSVRGGSAGPVSLAAILGLTSLALFFVGQATLNSYMPSIGRAIGLDPASAGRIIGLAMPFGFVGALLARAIGEHVSPIIAVGLVTVLLAGFASLVTFSPATPAFIAAMIVLAVSTMFSVPYFFALLGGQDAHGRYTSLGPAMMLIGVGLGPTAAVLLDASAGLKAVGLFSSALLLLSGAAFAGSISINHASSLRRNIHQV